MSMSAIFAAVRPMSPENLSDKVTCDSFDAPMRVTGHRGQESSNQTVEFRPASRTKFYLKKHERNSFKSDLAFSMRRERILFRESIL